MTLEVDEEEDDDGAELGVIDWIFEDDEPPLELAPLTAPDDDEEVEEGREDPAEEPEEDDEEDDEEDEEAEAAPAPAPPPVATVAPPKPPCDVVVGPGDCVLSLARRYETSAAAIWSAPENAALRARRARPNQLLVGDVVHIPAKEERSVRVQSDRRHRFRLVEPEDCEVCIRLRREGEDRRHVPFTLLIDGQTFEGVTDASGRVKARVRRSARSGTLVLHDPAGEERYPVRLGHLAPLDEDAPVPGAQARLNHLGFPCGALDGVLGPRTSRAIRLFQRSRELPVTGELDGATRDALRTVHGS